MTDRQDEQSKTRAEEKGVIYAVCHNHDETDHRKQSGMEND